MTPMLWWLAQNTLLAAALAVLVTIACRVGRFRPAVCHALWLLVLLKLVAPPLWPCPWPTTNETVYTVDAPAPPRDADWSGVPKVEEADPAEFAASESLYTKWLERPPTVLSE